MSKLQDERTKLSATFLNGISIAMVAAGGIAPLVAFSDGLASAAAGTRVAFVGAAWFVGGTALHFVARFLLRGMKP
jgi:hypothetical protein